MECPEADRDSQDRPRNICEYHDTLPIEAIHQRSSDQAEQNCRNRYRDQAESNQGRRPGDEEQHDGQTSGVHHVPEVRDALSDPQPTELGYGQDVPVTLLTRWRLVLRDLDAPSLGNDRFKRFDHGWVVPGSCQLPKFGNRFGRRLNGRTENPRLRDGVEGIAGVDNSRADRYLFSLELVRIAGTVPSLMMMHHDFRDVLLLRILRQGLSPLS